MSCDGMTRTDLRNIINRRDFDLGEYFVSWAGAVIFQDFSQLMRRKGYKLDGQAALR